MIDELSLFNIELSASDVESIFNNGIPNNISNLNTINWWRMGDHSSDSPTNNEVITTITDSGENENDATQSSISYKPLF